MASIEKSNSLNVACFDCKNGTATNSLNRVCITGKICRTWRLFAKKTLKNRAREKEIDR